MDFSNYLNLINNCRDEAPVLSDTPLGKCLSFIPLKQVAPSDLLEVTQSLNVEQLIGTNTGLARDYRGLAELMGFSSIELEAHFKRTNNPTKCLINAYIDKVLARNSHNTPATATTMTTTTVTVNDLLNFLERLERFDIIDDFLPTLVTIANDSQRKTSLIRNNHHHQQQQQQLNSDCRVVAPPLPPPPPTAFGNHHQHRQPHMATTETETIGGTHRPESVATLVQQYDAIVCYAPEDFDHAMGLIRILEQNDKYIVTPDNILAGQLKYNALVQMIAEQCNKVILILTPNFINSKDCDFQAKFAFEIAIKSAQSAKVIPIVYEQIDDSTLPPLLRVISKIDMTHKNAKQHGWQLRKLLGSLNVATNSASTNKSIAYYEHPHHHPHHHHTNQTRIPLAITLNSESCASVSSALSVNSINTLDNGYSTGGANSVTKQKAQDDHHHHHHHHQRH